MGLKSIDDLVQLQDYLISPPTEFFGSPTVSLNPSNKSQWCANPLAALMVSHGTPATECHPECTTLTGDEMDQQVDKIVMTTVNW